MWMVFYKTKRLKQEGSSCLPNLTLLNDFEKRHARVVFHSIQVYFMIKLVSFSANITESSAYAIVLAALFVLVSSTLLNNIFQRVGPRTDPWGTPVAIFIFLFDTNALLLVR